MLYFLEMKWVLLIQILTILTLITIIDLNDNNFDEDGADTINLIRHLALHIKFEKHKALN